jgi:dihydroorotase
MPTILIKGGRVIDPASGLDRPADVLVKGKKIAAVGRVTERADKVIDAKGKIVCPGLIDAHVHLREPGMAEAETIASGAEAAVAGGFTSVVAMPNTEPPVDSAASAEYVQVQAARGKFANVFPAGCISKGRKGEELAEMGMLAKAGCVGFSDDGSPVMNSELMRRAMEYARMLDKPILSHAEDKNLSAGGVMHEGAVSVALGLAGIPAESEIIAVERDIALARLTGARLHVQHVSTAGAVDAIRRAKKAGARVTAEAAIHHLVLTDECLLERDAEGIYKFDTNYKMNPPLRSKADVEAVRAGLADGTIDCIVSDHAPHPLEGKELEFPDAPFGIIGLETTLALVATELVGRKLLDWPAAIAAMTSKPAAAIGLAKGTLAVGADADVTVIDPDAEWTIDASVFRSRARNTPFGGRKVKGRASCVIVGGVVKT